ncbi:MAG: hypothetical protein LBQ54_01640 [Planctomycetaceae bacterium]|nr:hypothetical protein [Planctomycetaceae bacterium]
MKRDLITRLHHSPWRFVMAFAGGGSDLLSDLLTVPGASGTVIEAVVPYSGAAMGDFLGFTPEQFCSEQTARQLAMSAFVRAEKLEPSHETATAGLGVTASLATEHPKRGEHRFYWAVQTVSQTIAGSCLLEKGKRSREEEERFVADVLLEELCHVAEISVFSRTDCSRRVAAAPEKWRLALWGKESAVPLTKGTHLPKFLFSGSFHPMHDGHRKMAEIVREKYSRDVALELPLVNADKPPLDYIDLETRLAGIGGGYEVWLSRLATFRNKSRFFQGVTFIVGADTLRRIAEPRYYGSAENRDSALRELAENRCRFLCFPRKNGHFIETVETLSLPEPLRNLCLSVSPEVFCEDISSTQLREQKMS